ncbi:hypothetical protein BKA70DRAFT_1255166 [Coprinopsis sp. MPI-PUGE-AT-0042]|nr:hypothetical protein BKA70DRAFT_1255166 [Coprinopsis sp. MPI-PUGE-AT-0042]
MAEQQPPPPGVDMFGKSTALTICNSRIAAAGRDHFTLNVSVTTPAQEPTKQDPSIVAALLRGLIYGAKWLYNYILAPPGISTPVPGPDIRSSLYDGSVLCDGIRLSRIDSPSNAPQPRNSASSEEEVYERSFLPKGHGYPMYHPPPLGASVKLGDIGIITQDGFQSFGNLYTPLDREKFSVSSPPVHDVIQQSEKWKEGQTFVTGMEDAKRPNNEAQGTRNTIGTFEFHCRKPQGAVLAITSSAHLETISHPSKNELRQYLWDHGTTLMAQLRAKRCLNPGSGKPAGYAGTGTQGSGTGRAFRTLAQPAPFGTGMAAPRSPRHLLKTLTALSISIR